MRIESALPLILLASVSVSLEAQVRFTETTDQAGIVTTATWKYGGPTLADFDGDGRYDLVLLNHHEAPAQLFLSEGAHRFRESDPVMQGDVHGIAAGDYDRDGLIDLVVSMGGGNGSNPQPPRLLHNTGNGFEDRTESAGIADLGARGRSVRWMDIDLDGDLDLLQINARQIPGETGPRNILFENDGDGTFTYRSSPAFEKFEGERLLVTDLNGDRVPDLVTFTPLMVWMGKKDFQYYDATAAWLAELSDESREFAMAVSEADIDNDGDMDLYVARGKTYYEIADNSIDFNPATGRLDLRDEGNKSQDAISFAAEDSVGLQDFFHWPRGVDLVLPVFLGAAKSPIDTPVEPVSVNAAEAEGFPESLEQNGWYLGHLGDGEWRLAWNLDDNLAWDVRASVTGVKEAKPHWTPQERGVPDLLLINEGDHFRDASATLPPVSADNNWGVITGDFDNDMQADLFIYRFGGLHSRVEDVLLYNSGNPETPFTANFDHGANNLPAGGHGDMGAPLDYDRDGRLDILSGSDDMGRWHLYRNTGASENRSVTIRVGNSPEGTGPHGAQVFLTTGDITQYKRVASRGAVHSQSLYDRIHFGLGRQGTVDEVRVRWRDGTETVRKGLSADETHAVGSIKSGH